MDSVECTHCQVTMTSWSAAGSPVRYFQCPLCARTYSSLYDEVFRAEAGARRLGVPARPAAPTALPMASREAQQWATVRARATRWFSRLESDQRRAAGSPAPPPRAQRSPPVPALAAAAARPARHR
jgi:hypothetical protein